MPANHGPRRSRRLPRHLVAGALITLALAVGLGDAPAAPRIVNGLDSHDFETTGQLLLSQGGVLDSWCSGTLIGCKTFLTAAHCVEDESDPAEYGVYLQHAGLFSVTSIASHPLYSFPTADVAVLTLGSTVTGIDPTEINTLDSPHNLGFGLAGEIAGFGRTGGSNDDYGIKRAGMVSTTDCTPIGGSNDELVCWSFDAPIGPPGDDSNTCNGDSGGPLFMDIGAGNVVAGITSGGTSGDCLPTDNSYDANVYTYRAFILANLGIDPTTTCGSLDPVGDPGTTVQGDSGSLGAGNQSDDLVVGVPAGAAELRFGFNAEANGSLRADFYVKHGLGAGPGDFDCAESGVTNFGGCAFAAPAAGDWSVHVSRTAGSGQYQVTSTVFGGTPPVCGNNQQETGEECDGTDASACPGLCQIDCTCPAPVCGNNVAETGEECDGIDDAACPGLCDGTCSCPASCLQGDVDLFSVRMRSDEKRFVAKFDLFNFAGDYDGLMPNDGGFRFTASQGGDSVVVDIAGADPGWAKSKPEKGRFIWKSKTHPEGWKVVKAIDRTAKKGEWRIRVKGKEVPGAADIETFFTVHLELVMDGVCTEDDW